MAMAKKKKRDEDSAPGWMVTFADLMTILLTFFVLLLAFSVTDVERYRSIADALKNSFGLQAMNPLNIIPSDNSYPRTESLIPPIQPEASMEEGEDSQTDLEILGNRLETNFVDEIERGLIIVERDEDHIIIRFPEETSFGSGSDMLEPEMIPILQKAGEIIEDHEVFTIVGGHTDDRPIHTSRYRSNWDLSAARAVSVAHELTWLSDIDNRYLYVVGHADARPLAPNDTDENRAKNRRVEILLIDRNNSERTVYQGMQQVSGYQ